MLKNCLMNFVSWLRHAVRSAWFWITIGVVSLTVAVCELSIRYWDWLSIGESNASTMRNTILALVAVIALPLAIWRSIVAEKQAETAQRSLLNERYQKGAEMLGSAVLSVRLGGIYALARLAREHPGDYHKQIMSLLCAFVRSPPVVEKGNQSTKRLREDVQAIMMEIATRGAAQIEIEKKEDFRLNLSGADLHGVDLAAAPLAILSSSEQGLVPIPRANLEGAYLVDVDLSGAALPLVNLKDARLYRTNLREAFLAGTDLSSADLKNCKGLTQEQIGETVAHKDYLPDLTDSIDAATGKPLVWSGKSLVLEPKVRRGR